VIWPAYEVVAMKHMACHLACQDMFPTICKGVTSYTATSKTHSYPLQHANDQDHYAAYSILSGF